MDRNDRFFEAMEAQFIGLTYDDVRIRTAASSVLASEVDLKTRFSRNIELNVPFVSAAMDRVTGHETAIAMAKLGGIGVIHAGSTIDEQRREVRKVKLALNGLIERPVSVYPEQTFEEVLRMCDENEWDFRTLTVVDQNKKFVGLLTQNDFDLNRQNPQRIVGDAMTPKEKVEFAPRGTSIKEANDRMHSAKKKTLPLLNEDGTVAGLYVLSDVERNLSADSESYSLDENKQLLVAAAIPPLNPLERVQAVSPYADALVIDSAQGDAFFGALKALQEIKHSFPNIDVVVGNISSGESVAYLAERGADGIKVGQGGGSICTTRPETGIGTPQVTAINDCYRAARQFGIPICADGGIRNRGDVSIAIAAGASSVMMGRVLAGTKESPGEILTHQGMKVKSYDGMGSLAAMKRSQASRDRYGDGSDLPLEEGVESYVPYSGESVVGILNKFTKALRKSMSYTGNPDIASHRANSQFIRITTAGLIESGAHDVDVRPSSN